MKNISIRMEEETISKINKIAELEDRDRSYIINKAVKEYLDYQEYILQQINEGIKDIEEGRVYSEKEVFAFLEEKKQEVA
jgi:predicted transcriptional regulator